MKNAPGVYTRVSAMTQWIEETMASYSPPDPVVEEEQETTTVYTTTTGTTTTATTTTIETGEPLTPGIFSYQFCFVIVLVQN